MTKRLAFLCALALIVAPRPSPAAEGDARLHALEVIRTDGIQAHMPGTVEDKSGPPQAEPSPEPPPPEQRSLIDLPEWAVKALLWGTALAGLGSILWSLRFHMPRFRPQPFLPLPEQPAETPENKVLEVAQDEADHLAQQGRFVDAMHLLLLRALAEMRRRLDVAFADSLTSREILKQSKLSGTASASLAEIIRLVETTYFGRQPAGAEDYQACRALFETLRRALRTGVAA